MRVLDLSQVIEESLLAGVTAPSADSEAGPGTAPADGGGEAQPPSIP